MRKHGNKQKLLNLVVFRSLCENVCDLKLVQV